MSSYQKPLFLNLLSAILISHIGHAAAERAWIKLNGQRVATLTHAACNADVELELPRSALDTGADFRFFIRKAKKDKEKPEAICGEKLKDEKKGEKFSGQLLKGREIMPGSACGKSPKGISETWMLCIFEDSGEDAPLLAYSPILITKAPRIEKANDDLSAINGTVRFVVRVSNATGKERFRVCHVEGDHPNLLSGAGCPFKSEDFGRPDIEITGLTNRKNYVFKVLLMDPTNPDGTWSAPFLARPVAAIFPLGAYDGGGGELQWSCQTGGSSSHLLLMVMLLLLALRYRNRAGVSLSKMSVALFFIAALGAPEDLRAEAGQVNVGLLGSPYLPGLDGELLDSGKQIFPFYRCFFSGESNAKDGPITPLLGLEVDWHIWDGFGSLQLGLGLGYTFVGGKAVEELDVSGKPDCDSPVANAKTYLHMYQLRPQLTYVFSPYVDYFPLIPYLRAGLVVHGYSFTGHGNAALNVKPNGFRFGYQAALGLMLRLDFLEPSTVTHARGEGFFEHVYLKSELSYTKIDSFGSKGFQFSPKDVMGTAWPLMWTFGIVFELL